MTNKKRKYYDSIASNLIGRKIIEVYYEEINDESFVEFWNLSSDVHSIDMNVIFILDNNKIVQLKWDNEFYCYGIGFEILGEIKFEVEGFKIINVSNNQNWKIILNKKITSIAVFWDTIDHFVDSNLSNETLLNPLINKLPQTWEIEIEEKKIWISALEIRNEQPDYFWADHLTIFFSEESHQKYNLIEFADKKHKIN